MLIQVRLLGEAELAALSWAYVWSLLRVNSQVIEEIVPLLKMLHALIALEDFHMSFALRIFIGEYLISLG